MLRKKIKLYYFALIISLLDLILYHFAFYQFIVNHIEVASLHGMVLLISLTLLAIVLNALVFYMGLFLLGIVGKWLLVLFFNTNAIALYFINTYGVIIDKTMIGNILNTRFEESSSFFSLPLILYVLFLGIIPSIFLFRFTIISVKIKQFSFHVLAALFFLLTLAFANASNWLWIDKHSKTLGAIVMPWSYVVNTIRFFQHQSEKNKTQILLPNATLKNNTKSIVVLVIGESARSANFSLYGYHKKTNPILSTIKDLHVYPAKSAATYTTAGVKAILDHKETNQLYEILPNYLDRNGVAVIWRTTNWGEPTVKAKNYANKEALRAACKKPTCLYDEVLLHDLKTEIQNTKKDKIFVVLHTSTSHGPTYFKKYPAQFNQFTPVCKSVVLADCSQEELINAYDNTILYTDYILANVIKELRQLDDYQTTMLYVSDHGESLGEKNLYMHGIPMAIAPKEQVEIPFITWSATDSIVFKEPYEVSQYHVFHSVLDLLAIDSPIYNEQMSIVKKNN